MVVAMDMEHADAVSPSLCVLRISIPGAPPCALAVSGKGPTPDPQLSPLLERDIPGAYPWPFVVTAHAVSRPRSVDADSTTSVHSYTSSVGFRKCSVAPSRSFRLRSNGGGFVHSIREEGHETRS